VGIALDFHRPNREATEVPDNNPNDHFRPRAALPAPDLNLALSLNQTLSPASRRHTSGAIGNSTPRFRMRMQWSRTTSWKIEMDDRTVRMALERHWNASDASDFQVEHEIYCEDAVLDYPQSGERIRGRHNIQESRFVQPNKKRFTVRRIAGSGDLWITEF